MLGRTWKLLVQFTERLLKLGLKALILVILLLGSFVLLGNYLNLSQNPEPVDAIIVLSGGDTKARTKAGIELYKAGWSNLIIFSGAAADPKSKSNAVIMKEQAISAGVPDSSIVIEDKSVNTSENARQVAKKISELKIDKVILVTSGYHIRRAKLEVQDQSRALDIIPYTSKDSNWSPNTWWLTPYGWWVTSSEAMKLLLVAFR
jgi:uncharacterized SAM-binding protein YcdF (DUF218 family)